MRINIISAAYSQNFIGNSTSNIQHKKQTSKALNIGVATVGATIAIGAIGLNMRKGKIQKTNFPQIQLPEQIRNPIDEIKHTLEILTKNFPKKLTKKQLTNATITKIKTSPFSRIYSETPNPRDYERMFYVDYKDGTGRVYRRLYHNDKIYESSIYETQISEKGNQTMSRFDYYFAYENGKIAGVAKRCIYQDGEPYGTYLGKEYIPFPLMVKMKGEKEFTASSVYTIDELAKTDSRFNIRNI